MMKYLKSLNNYINEKFYTSKSNFSDNVTEYIVDKADKNTISKFKEQFPNKWILSFDNSIFVKDKPKEFNDELPKKVYHVSKIDNLDKIGIKPSTETNTPFGYYNISFFYLNKNDANYGSISLNDNNYLYEIDTNANVKWLEGFNKPIDGEKNITTSDYIEPKYIKKL